MHTTGRLPNKNFYLLGEGCEPFKGHEQRATPEEIQLFLSWFPPPEPFLSLPKSCVVLCICSGKALGGSCVYSELLIDAAVRRSSS